MPQRPSQGRKSVIRAVTIDIDSHPAHNEILRALPVRERLILFPRLKLVRLPVGSLLAAAGEPIKFGFS